MPDTAFQKKVKKRRIMLIAVLSIIACLLTYYFHAILRTETLVSHFYYIPIILACLWMQDRGVIVAVLLASFLAFSHTFWSPASAVPDDYIRALMLIVIASVVAILSKRIARAEAYLRRAYDDLEIRVENRTADLAKTNQDLKQEIKQRLLAEKRLEQSAIELERRNEEIKGFAYIVSHDLRAPLINLRGFASELRNAVQIISNSLDPGITPSGGRQQRPDLAEAFQDAAEALDFIDSSVNRMDGFINAVLKLSRLGRSELTFEQIDMNEIVRETLQTLAHQIEKGGVRVTAGPLPQVVADRVAIQQVTGNLINNAILYLDPARPGVIEITAESGIDQVTFHVKDNGRGIAREDLNKVFMPFRRVGRQDVSGEGMGLAYAQTLINRHNGRIWCESELGAGTTFSFTISSNIFQKG